MVAAAHYGFKEGHSITLNWESGTKKSRQKQFCGEVFVNNIRKKTPFNIVLFFSKTLTTSTYKYKNESYSFLFFSSPEPRVPGELIGKKPPSSQFLEDFFYETTGPISFKFHMQSPGNGGKKVYIFRPGHLTKMAAMPMYSKNLKKIFFSRDTGPIALKPGK